MLADAAGSSGRTDAVRCRPVPTDGGVPHLRDWEFTRILTFVSNGTGAGVSWSDAAMDAAAAAEFILAPVLLPPLWTVPVDRLAIARRWQKSLASGCDQSDARLAMQKAPDQMNLQCNCIT